METVTQVAGAMQHILTEVADRLGKESGFIQRQGLLSGSIFAQSLVFGWLANGQSSMEELSQSAANVGVAISRQGLEERFTEKAAHFLRALLEAAIGEVIRSQSVDTPVIRRFNGVYVLDSTVIQLPDALQALWQGCKGSALKISVCWDIQQGGLEAVQLQAGREHDQKAAMQHASLPAGALRLADLGYFSLDVLHRLDQENSYWVSRYKGKTGLFTAEGIPLDLVAHLKTQTAEQVSCQVQLGQEHRLACRLVAQRLPLAAQQQRSQQLRQWQSKHQALASEERWFLTAWNVYLTNAPLDILSDEEVLSMAHVRWQIELLFKLWKSHMQLDKWATRNPWRMLCEIYAKLLALVIQHWLFLTGDVHHLRMSLLQAQRTIRKKAWHLAAALTHSAALLAVIQSIQFCLRKGCRISTSSSSQPTFQRFYP